MQAGKKAYLLKLKDPGSRSVQEFMLGIIPKPQLIDLFQRFSVVY